MSYKKVLTLTPDDAETHNNLGAVYLKAKRYAEAATSFKAATRLRPDYVDAHFNLAVTFVLLKDRKGVQDEYDILKRLDARRADDFAKRFRGKQPSN